MDKLLYNDKEDTLYLLIYVIGNGTSAKVWFSIEFKNFIRNLKMKKTNIDCKALKIFLNDDSKEYKKDSMINNILTFNGKKSDYINYPLSNFNYNNNDIIVYDVMYDLYDLCKLYEFNFENEFKNIIVQQMKESLDFVHNCGYIHTDIKIDNYLLQALDLKQYNIMEYVKNYNFKNLLNKNYSKNPNNKILELATNDLVKFINIILDKFNLQNNDDDDEDDDCDDEINEGITEDNISDLTSYDTDEESFTSEYYEYSKNYDKFHINKINNIINKMDIDDEISNNDDKDENKIYLNKYLLNPKLKLSDFGLIKKENVNETTNARDYRCPEVILGYKCGKELDYWSLDITIYEFLNGHMLYKHHKTDEYGYYNNDLISLKLILNKCNKNEFNRYIDLIKNSNRKNYILSKDDSLLFYKSII